MSVDGSMGVLPGIKPKTLLRSKNLFDRTGADEAATKIIAVMTRLARMVWKSFGW